VKLYFAAPSPFARKVRVLIAEKGLQDIEQEAVDPFSLPPELVAVNPLSKVPVLVLENGSAVYDSPVICEYLDSISDSPALIPRTGATRWTVLRRQALADGLMDTALSLALEINRRPEQERSSQWIERWCATLRRSIDALEEEIPTFGRRIDMSHIAAGCALAYLDLRTSAHIAWRDGCPDLSAWFASFDQRASMRSTQPA
jgi:glutathione S-transferase